MPNQNNKIGIIGAGQLAKMLALAGHNLGFKFSFFDPNPESPAFELGEKHIHKFEDTEALMKFASSVDFLTYEFENIPADGLERLESSFCGSISRPSGLSSVALAKGASRCSLSYPLKISQDRLLEKTFVQDLGIKVAPFSPVNSIDEIQKIVLNTSKQNSLIEYILKTRCLGYDGKGQVRISTENFEQKKTEIYELLKAPCILEEKINFVRELSIIAVRSFSGQIVFYPPAENTHKEGILSTSISPCLSNSIIDKEIEIKAQEIATKISESLGQIGAIAIEFFQTQSLQTQSGQLIVNEIAPRVHNTGHWSIEGCVTSQFENHIRAISQLPLGSTAPTGFSVMVNILAKTPNIKEVLTNSELKLHLYGKTERSGRKLGHITTVTQNAENRRIVSQKILQLLSTNNC